MSEGNITRRGKASWRLKFDVGRDPETGKRHTIFVTVRGTKKDAERELRRRMTAADNGIVIEPSRLTVGEWLDKWLEETAALRVGAKSLERYGELARRQIKPHLGATPIQKLRPADIQAWHATLIKEGRIARRTIQHAHQILRKSLADAAAIEIVARNVAALVKPPPNQKKEMKILTAEQINDVIAKLDGLDIHAIAIVAFSTGLRRGELAALRWSDVDLDGATLRVERSLEQTAKGVEFKSPKTDAGRRTIAVPLTAVAALRQRRKEQLELRVVLGAGRLPDDALVFGKFDGTPRKPHTFSDAWRRAVKSRKLPKVTFHAFRHSHASALIASGLDVVTVSKRLGHASPAVTLAVYSHLFQDTDDRAAAAIDDVFGAG